jgi:hypothetical protein
MKLFPRSIIIAILVFSLLPALALSQSNDTILVADVNIYNAEIVSQEGHTIDFLFDLSNGEMQQPAVKYAAYLQNPDTNKFEDIKVYPEVLSLGEEVILPVSQTYEAPPYLDGNYTLWIVSENEKALRFAQAIAGEVTLEGEGDYVYLNPQECNLSVGEDTYPLRTGIGVHRVETLDLFCPVEAPQGVNISGALVETHLRSQFGEVVSTEEVDVARAPIPEDSVRLIIPIPNEPQAYDSKVVLLDSNGDIISNPVYGHYVVSGLSGTIQNVRFDKDYYSSGDTAVLTIFWSPSADLFPRSRLNGSEPTDISFEVSLAGEDAGACSETKTKSVSLEEDVIDMEVPITKNCLDPTATVYLMDGNITLDSSTVTVDSGAIEPTGPTVPEEGNVTGPGAEDEVLDEEGQIPIIYILLIIVIILVAIYYLKTKK